MAAGLGFKTFTTGEVLTAADTNGYLMQGINVFASTAARDAAITSPQEGQFAFTKDTNGLWYYDGAAWVASGATGDIEGVTAGIGISGGGTSGTVTVTNSMATAIDAKGDLIAGTAADTFDRLAVGNNGETLVADSGASTGLRYQSGYNGNGIINGGMDIWQRGTSIAYGANTGVYTADRWTTLRTATPGGATVSRQASSLTGIQYCARVQRDSGNTSAAVMYFGTNLESADSYRFAGQTVTLSYYARKGANYSPTSSELIGYIYTGTGTDQTFISGFTGGAQTGTGNVTLTTSWQRFTITAAIPSGTTQIAIYYAMTPTGTAGANDYFEVTGVQLELGSVATAFKRSSTSGGSIQGELAACQRYFVKYASAGSTPFTVASFFSTTQADGVIGLPVQMRTAPTLSSSGDLRVYDFNANFNSISTLVISDPDKLTVGIRATTTGGTQYRPARIQAYGDATAFVAFSAEL